MDSKTMFANMSPWRLFFTVALPGMVSMFAMSIFGALWRLGLDGIWLNSFGTSVLALILGVVFIKHIWNNVKK